MMFRRRKHAGAAPAGWGSYRSTRTYEVSPPITWENADEIAEWCATKPDWAARVVRDHPQRTVTVLVGRPHQLKHRSSAIQASDGWRLAYETTPNISNERWSVTQLARMELVEGGAS